MVTFSSAAYCATWIWFAVTAVMLSKVDLHEHRLPNSLVAVSFLGGLIGFCLVAITRGDVQILGMAIAGSLLASLAYLAIHLLGGMGMGDVKYAAVVGLYLGSLGWTYLYVGSLISFASAGLWVLPLIFSSRRSRKLPFGPFMALGVLAAGLIAAGVSAGA